MFEFRLPKDLSHRKLKRFSKEIEPQEVLLDGLAQRKEKEMGIREMKFELPTSRTALFFFLFFSLVSFSILFIQTFRLAVNERENLTALALQNIKRTQPLRTDRGVVYDRNFRQLVTNLPSFDLVLDKRDMPKDADERNQEIASVSGILGRDATSTIKQIDESSGESVLIAENLSQESLVALEARINLFPGFQVEKNTVRDYASGIFFSQILGYVGRINPAEFKSLKDKDYFISDYLGKQGLEKTYEETLRGKPGVFEVEKDVTGKKIKEGVRSEPEAGQSLVLWLDADLQEKLQTELTRITQEVGIKKAAAVALDPKTGGVLALVSLPSFDNNLFTKGESPEKLQSTLLDPNQPLFNRVVSGLYASGSTIKPLVAAAALQEKVISPEKQILDKGYIEIKNQYDPKITYVYHGVEPPGWYDLRRAIAISANIYFYTIGGGYLDQKGLGLSRIKKYLELFGWGSKTGIDLPQEAQGLIPDTVWKKENIGENWYVGDTYNLSIGQGYLQITPLQLATAFAGIANNGQILQPQVVQKIIEGTRENQKIIKEFAPNVLRQLPIDSQNLQIVREGMRAGVSYGSSALLNDLPVKAASKTGTAQTNRNNYYDNWIGVFAPYDDPQIVLLVMTEDVWGLRAASILVANETLKWYFSR